MFHTTFALAKEHGACPDSYKKVAKALGGVTAYGKDTPIPLTAVLEICGLDDAIWCLRCVLSEEEERRDRNRITRLLAWKIVRKFLLFD